MIMKEVARLGYQSVLVTSDSIHLANVPHLNKAYQIEFGDGMRICWVRTYKYKSAKSLSRIISWLDFELGLLRMPKGDLPTPDIIIISSLSLLSILSGFILRSRFKCRLVFEIRDIWPLTLTEEGGYSPYNPLILLLAFIEKLGYRYADIVVGTMPNLGEHVSGVLGYSRTVHCIPMGVSEDHYSQSRSTIQDIKKRYMLEDKFVIGYAGSIGITNSLDIFFQCADLFRANPHVHFLLIGDGDLRAGYEKKYSYLTNLSFVPKVPREEVQSVLSQCDLLYFSVHKSLVWRYGQSLNKIIDYMMSGKPIVASYTGYPSMIDESGCGSFVPAGDLNGLYQEIQRYINMPPDVRAEIGYRGRQWLLTNRSYNKLANDYLSVLYPKKSAHM